MKSIESRLASLEREAQAATAWRSSRWATDWCPCRLRSAAPEARIYVLWVKIPGTKPRQGRKGE